ncbi:NUDIX domain-containing protein [Halapricum hydrolyticum]|uniref:NUDIX domain-containing protein n=1 Tax=Halapricum hydrolyticum TaxID=2979991 RepID=A0AAE3ICZ8_9EURY|nr:NUDIX domain-containing protein [Halapricum hydrolyticum]MCU4718240.1 NUDIX domain-containing protein [Halapricum hydrolyticum]MCU4726319.1 NUDIX domain-containing protein [Halapricum hydrolyticum]
MDEHEVVTCVLRNEGAVLLVRRSDDAGSYPGRWGAITGYLAPERGAPPDSPETAARREIREETGLQDVALVRQGDPFAVEDADRGTRWRVHRDCEADTPTLEVGEEADTRRHKPHAMASPTPQRLEKYFQVSLSILMKYGGRSQHPAKARRSRGRS